MAGAHNRRQNEPRQHDMIVRVVADAEFFGSAEGTIYGAPVLRVVCACGAVVGGRRYQDRTMVTLTDLLEMFRLHSSELNATSTQP